MASRYPRKTIVLGLQNIINSDAQTNGIADIGSSAQTNSIADTGSSTASESNYSYAVRFDRWFRYFVIALICTIYFQTETHEKRCSDRVGD